MSTVKYARGPAALVLMASLALAGAYAMSGLRGASPDPAASGSSADVVGRERSIVAGRADAGTWFAYAEQLRAEGKPAMAADAYQRVLEKEPYHREARFWTAVCLAESANTQRLEKYMEKLVSGEAKLAVEIFQRRELAPHMSSPRMSALLEQARDQARD